MTRAMLIYNPTAGQIWSAFKPEDTQTYLKGHGWQVDIAPTQAAGDGGSLARKAVKEGYDVVIAAGGDGTLNEVAQSLAHSPVALGILPAGTTNVLAREFGIPLNIEEALTYLPTAQIRTVDLGKLNGQYFLLMAGVGYDAELLEGVNKDMKKIAGKTSVFTSGVVNLFNHKPFVFKIHFTQANGKRIKLKRSLFQVFISNAATYATDFRIAEEAKMDDGLLELHLFKSKRLRDTFSSLLAILLRRHKEWADFEHYQVRKVDIYARRRAPIQIDGDPVAHTPAHIEVVPAALKVLVPKP